MCRKLSFLLKFPKEIKFPGDYGEGEPPVPIPNTAVKPLCADGTCRVTGWESKSLPGVILKKEVLPKVELLFIICVTISSIDL